MQLLFPHETIRDSQKDLTNEIYESIKAKTSLIAHAPTGLGKTAASLSAALTYAIENKLTVIFVTPKHSQHRIAIETLKKIKQKYSLDFITIDLIGKRNMCAQPGSVLMTQNEFSEYCKKMIEEKQCNFYNNIKSNSKLSLETSAFLSEIQNSIMHVEELKEISAKRKLCPYEITILLGQKAKVIIADYHHIINTSIREDLLKKINKDLSEVIVIFDESHNLPERARDLLSSQLSTISIELAAKEAKNLKYDEIAEDILKLKEILEKLIREKTSIENNEALIKKEEFVSLVNKNMDYDELLGNILFIAEESSETKKKSFAKAVYSFLLNWKGPDKSFTRVLKKGFSDRGNIVITLSYKCLDPSLVIKPITEESHSSIFMSGTLNPVEMYKDLFGVN